MGLWVCPASVKVSLLTRFRGSERNKNAKNMWKCNFFSVLCLIWDDYECNGRLSTELLII